MKNNILNNIHNCYVLSSIYCNKHYFLPIERDDVISIALLSLVECNNSYKTSYNTKFFTYYKSCLKYRLKDYLKDCIKHTIKHTNTYSV